MTTTGTPRSVVPRVPPELSYSCTWSRTHLAGLGSYSPSSGIIPPWQVASESDWRPSRFEPLRGEKRPQPGRVIREQRPRRLRAGVGAYRRMQVLEDIQHAHGGEQLEARGIRRLKRQRAVLKQLVDVAEHRRKRLEVGAHGRRGRAPSVSLDRPRVIGDERPHRGRHELGGPKPLVANHPPPQLRVGRHAEAKQAPRERLKLLLSPALSLLDPGAVGGI